MRRHDQIGQEGTASMETIHTADLDNSVCLRYSIYENYAYSRIRELCLSICTVIFQIYLKLSGPPFTIYHDALVIADVKL